MRRPHRPTGARRGRGRGRGSIAVEAALALPVLLAFLALPSVAAAYYYRQYSAAEKAAHDAALYLSTAPRSEMTTAGPDGSPAALTVARTILASEMAELVPSGASLDPGISCVYRVASSPNMKPCTLPNNGDPTHTLIQLGVSIRVPYIDPLTGDTKTVASYVLVPYVGN